MRPKFALRPDPPDKHGFGRAHDEIGHRLVAGAERRDEVCFRLQPGGGCLLVNCKQVGTFRTRRLIGAVMIASWTTTSTSPAKTGRGANAFNTKPNRSQNGTGDHATSVNRPAPQSCRSRCAR